MTIPPNGATDTRPHITIFITNFNYARFISQAIESALAQTYDRVSIMVVDDGSTDNSVEVIQRYSEVRLLSKLNGGQVSAVIHGTATLSGDIVIFLDSDDYLYPHACQEIAAAYAPGISLIQYRLDKKRSGTAVGQYPDFPFMDGDLKSKVLRHGFIHSSPTSGNAFSVEHVRRMLQTIDPSTEGRNYIDGYLIFSAPFTGTVKVINRALGAYNVHGANVSLAGGKTLKSVTNSINSAIWQRKGYLRIASPDGGETEIDAKALMSLSASQYRNAFLVEKAYGTRLVGEMSRASLVMKSMARFLRFPGMSPARRVYNAVAAAALFVAPASVCRKLIPRS
ncbi:glycosyltransferase family A protein [Bradyrhizobium sp. 141]|uniref:glycosyltransferase family 2 protein n=1 Tax=Bradyrhizobium sp. 141 TaxID=2782617 RepID=UPI001FF6FE99|nr:glycosyltransferase family A protein [Bradyrhizobium sp. 141]MCK1722062.1 glycosyltransferase family 2 protein [Bradyrhizobium sp. 141]